MLGNSVVSIAIANGDRWVASWILDPGAFKSYTLLSQMVMLASSIQSVANADVYSRIAIKYAGDRASARRYALKATVTAFAGSGVTFALVGSLFAFGVSLHYGPIASLTWITLTFVGICMLRCSDFLSSYLYICGSERQLLLSGIRALLIASIVWAVGVAVWPINPLLKCALFAAFITMGYSLNVALLARSGGAPSKIVALT
jgi:hypothetical protein